DREEAEGTEAHGVSFLGLCWAEHRHGPQPPPRRTRRRPAAVAPVDSVRGAGRPAAAMEHKLKAWVVFEGGTKFGGGRAELLRLVDAEGSLKRAVERMGMSYRAAWGYVRELEKAAGFALLERSGTGPSSGTRLTAEGRAFLAAFETFRTSLDAAAA